MRAVTVAAAVMVVAAACRELPAQSQFALGFREGYWVVLTGPQGDPWMMDMACTLSCPVGEPGAQGWSLSLAAKEATITRIQLEGSEAAALFAGGFERSELTIDGTLGCAGKSGAVSAVVLAFHQRRTLPEGSSLSVALITVEGSIPEREGVSSVGYVDGCRGSGQPVLNDVAQEGHTVKPVPSSLTIEQRATDPCVVAPILLGFSAVPVSSLVPYEGIADDGAGVFSGSGGQILKRRALGSEEPVHVYANIVSRGAGRGVQGWSLSIALDPTQVEIGPSPPRVEGLPALEAHFSNGFKKTESIEGGTTGSAQYGFISAVVLSFAEPRVLPPTGTESVLDMELSSTSPQDEADIVSRLRFRDGLRGSGQPVANVMTVDGSTVLPCNVGTAEVELVFGSRIPLTASPLVRGDANDDARIDIADAVFIINVLFRRGRAAACAAAADVNDDDLLDASDATYLIGYLFLHGAEPPPPFGACGQDSTATPESCPADSVAACR